MNSISFVCMGHSFSLFCFWKTTLPDRVVLVGRFFFFFFQYLEYIIFTLSWPMRFLLRNLLITLWEFHCELQPFFPLLLLRFFSVFAFWQFYYNVSWRRHFKVKFVWLMSFMNLDVQIFSDIWEVFSHFKKCKLSVPFSLSSASGTQIISSSFLLLVSHRSCRLSSLFFFFFFVLLWLNNFKGAAF